MSTVVSVMTPSGERTAEVELPPAVFDVTVNIPLIHQVVVAQEAAARQGTHATKTRGDVRGGGKKPYRQKGTGRARQGSLRAPQYAGGGVVHGPVPRSYVQRTPKKMKAAALRGALSDRARHGRVLVVSGFVTGEEPSTRDACAVLRQAVGETGSRLTRPVLVVTTAADELTRKSLRNAVGVRVLPDGQLNTYDVLACDHVVFTEEALAAFLARVSGAGTEDAAGAAKPAAAKDAAKAPSATKKPTAAKAATAKTATAKPATAKPATAKAATAKAATAKAATATSESAEPEVGEAASAAEASVTEAPAKKPAAKKPAAKKTVAKDGEQ